MAYVTLDAAPAAEVRAPGFFARLLAAIGASQMRKARAAARPHLLALDDDALAALGHKREEIRRWESLASWV